MDTELEVKKINERIEERERRGRDAHDIGWQASLELCLAMAADAIPSNIGRTISIGTTGDKEWERFTEAACQLDLPPSVVAVFVPPSARQRFLKKSTKAEPTAHWLVISHYEKRDVVIMVSAPGALTSGIDVYEDGKHFGDYTYNSPSECLKNTNEVVWTYLKPAEITTEDIIRYTENWFAKREYTFNLEALPLHTEYSYVHHPDLIGATRLKAAFKLLQATIAANSLEDFISDVNDTNQDDEDESPIITKEGLLSDNTPECKALIDGIYFEMDMMIDSLQCVIGRVRGPHYASMFDKCAKAAYKQLVGRDCPVGVVDD